MRRRSVLAIALRVLNEEGGTYFMSLLSEKRIRNHNWTELPIDDEVIAIVEELARLEGQPELPYGLWVFKWAPGIEIDTNEEEDNSLSEIELQGGPDIEQEIQDEYRMDNNVITDESDNDSEDENEGQDHKHRIKECISDDYMSEEEEDQDLGQINGGDYTSHYSDNNMTQTRDRMSQTSVQDEKSKNDDSSNSGPLLLHNMNEQLIVSTKQQ